MELEQIKIKDKQYIGFAESRIGGRSENQDSYGYAETPHGLLVTVCDGMGGGPGGKTASSIAVSEIINFITNFEENEIASNIVIKAIRNANMAIYEKGMEIPELMGMGSTCTVLLINNKSATLAHVGDSRIYQFRGGKKVFRTFDHSMVFDLVKQNVITEEQARLSAQSHIVTRVLGTKPDVEVDVTEVPYEKNDMFMLCSDGIHGVMPEKELIKLSSNTQTPLGTLVDNIATKVDGIGRNSGEGYDNLTLAIVRTNTNSEKMEIMKKRLIMIAATLLLLLIVSLGININSHITDKSDSEPLDSTLVSKEKVKSVLNNSGIADSVVSVIIEEINK